MVTMPGNELAPVGADVVGRCPALLARAARQCLKDPMDVWAPMVLAEHATQPSARLALLRVAIHAGLRRWMPERRARPVAWWDETETRPLLMAIYAFGHQAAVMGLRDDTALCVKQLLKMDPSDRLGAEELGRSVGLFPAAALETAAGMRM